MTTIPDFPTIPALHAAYAAGLDPVRVIEEAYRRLAAAPPALRTLYPARICGKRGAMSSIRRQSAASGFEGRLVPRSSP